MPEINFIDYIPSTKAISYNIKKEKHTAGTTDDPYDYKIPNVKEKLSPKKLFRINPFHKNFAEHLELHKTNVDPDIIFPTVIKEARVVETDYSDMGLNQDQIDFLIALKNLKTLKVEDVSKKLDIDQFSITDEKLMEGFFQLYPRFMETLAVGATVGNLNYEEEEESESSFSQNSPESEMMAYHLKKMGFDPKQTKLKKNFEVRTGNAKDKQITPYLQERTIEKTTQKRVSQVNNSENLNVINITNKNRFEHHIRNTATVYSNEQKYNTLVQNLNQTKNITNNQFIRVKRESTQDHIDFKEIFNKLIKDLNIKNDVVNLYNREINVHSRNVSVEFLSQINQSFTKEYNTNIKNQTSAYNFYRYIENRYREFIQNLNFYNETLQEFKKTEYKIRNNYQNIHQHNFTQKNQYNKSVINLTKEINFETSMVDYTFKSAILKTIQKSNSNITNQIENIRENLNVTNNNVTNVSQKVSVLRYKTENRISSEVRNILNNQDFSDEYSQIIINKISNISNNTDVKKLLSIVKNEETLEKLSYIVKQSNIDVNNIKVISDIINVSKNANFNISKVSSESVSKIKKLITLSQTDNNFEFKSSNMQSLSKQELSFTKSDSFTINNTSNKSLNNAYKTIAGNIFNVRNSSVSNIVQLSNLVNNISKNENLTNNAGNVIDILNKISVNKEIIQDTLSLSSTVNNLLSKNYVQSLEKIANSNISNTTFELIKNINNISQTSEILETVNQLTSIFKNISEYKEINESTFKMFENLSQTSIDEKVVSLAINLVKNISQVSNTNQMTEIFSEIVTIFSQISNVKEIANSISEISNINLSKTSVDNIIKLSNIENEKFIQNINLVKEKKFTERINVLKKISNYQNIDKIEETLSLVNQTTENNKDVINKISNNKQINTFIKLLQNSNLNSNQISRINKISSQNINNILQIVNTSSVNEITKLSKSSSNFENVNKIINDISKIDQTFTKNIIQKFSNIKDTNLITNINLTKNEVQSAVRLEKQFRSYSEKVKIQETLKTLDLIERKPEINQFLTNKISYSQLNKMTEVFENLNILKFDKNVTAITRQSFESNKKNISNVFNELNITSIIKSERKTEKTFSSINKQIERLYKMNQRVENKANKAEQSFYDLINFSDFTVSNKTSTKKEIRNFFQTLNQVKITNQKIKDSIKTDVRINEVRIKQSTDKVKIDVHKQKTDNYYKVENVNRFYKKSYYEEKQEKEAQEKVIESKVEELLVQKIQNVTNNITNNVITKQELNLIKQEIVREIFKVEEKYEQKIQAIRQETKQTVQSMLNQFLKS